MTITLNVSTPQEAYDAVKAHLAGMTSRCYSVKRDSCMYREFKQPGDRRCAIGSLIPDDQYNPTLDESNETSLGGYNVSELLRREVIATDLDLQFLSDLQFVHDHPGNWNDFGLNMQGRDRLFQVSADWNLIP